MDILPSPKTEYLFHKCYSNIVLTVDVKDVVTMHERLKIGPSPVYNSNNIKAILSNPTSRTTLSTKSNVASTLLPMWTGLNGNTRSCLYIWLCDMCEMKKKY